MKLSRRIHAVFNKSKRGAKLPNQIQSDSVIVLINWPITIDYPGRFIWNEWFLTYLCMPHSHRCVTNRDKRADLHPGRDRSLSRNADLAIVDFDVDTWLAICEIDFAFVGFRRCAAEYPIKWNIFISKKFQYYYMYCIQFNCIDYSYNLKKKRIDELYW